MFYNFEIYLVIALHLSHSNLNLEITVPKIT